MPVAKILVTLVIIFVGMNLLLIIYNSVNRKIREGFDDQNACPRGCSRSENIDKYCSDRVISADGIGGNYRQCHYRCPGPYDPDYDVDQRCDDDKECTTCGTYNVPTDPNGYPVHPQNTTGLVAANEPPKYSQFGGGNQQRMYSGTYKPSNNLGVPANENDPTQIAQGALTDLKDLTDDGEKKIQSMDNSVQSELENPWKTHTTGTDTSQAQLSNADDQSINNKRCPLYENSSYIHNDTVPQTYTNTRTTNMLSYNPTKNNMDRKEGYAFSGSTIGTDSVYTDLMTATNECKNNTLCAGINFNITSGQYSLMSVSSTLKPRMGYIAYVKKPGSYGGIATHYGGGRKYKQKGDPTTDESPLTWTLVASITPSLGADSNKNNVLSNGSISSNASAYNVPDGIDRKHYDHHHYKQKQHDYYHDSNDRQYRRDERYQAPKTNNSTNNNSNNNNNSDRNISLTSGKPPDTPYTMFSPTNKPRNPNLEPRPYNSLMDLFR
jgi:hypothetical protein